MVIGNGLVAKSFSEYNNDSKFLIFASGVSNSKSTNQVDYERELNLLKQKVAENGEKTLVYFSTCSINDPAESRSAYVAHKRGVEEYIRAHVEKYVIIRVSNLVGHTTNNNT